MTPHLQTKLVVVAALTISVLGACGEDEGKTTQPVGTAGTTGSGGGGTVAGCGNGTITAPEQCEGLNLNGATCASATMSTRPNGTPTCSPQTCMLVTTGCTAPAGASGGSPPVGSGGMTAQGGSTTGAGGRM